MHNLVKPPILANRCYSCVIPQASLIIGMPNQTTSHREQDAIIILTTKISNAALLRTGKAGSKCPTTRNRSTFYLEQNT